MTITNRKILNSCGLVYFIFLQIQSAFSQWNHYTKPTTQKLRSQASHITAIHSEYIIHICLKISYMLPSGLRLLYFFLSASMQFYNFKTTYMCNVLKHQVTMYIPHLAVQHPQSIIIIEIIHKWLRKFWSSFFTILMKHFTQGNVKEYSTKGIDNKHYAVKEY